jgi:hypothetical protein
VLKIQSGGQLSILQGDCIQKNILLWDINILLWVIDLRKTKGSHSSVLKAVDGEFFCSKINLEASRQSYREIAFRTRTE